MDVKNTKNVNVSVTLLNNGKLYIGIIDTKCGEHACCTLTKKQAKKLTDYIRKNYETIQSMHRE